jgi:hypothetical protein
MLVIHRSWQQQPNGHDDAIVAVAGVAALDALLDDPALKVALPVSGPA